MDTYIDRALNDEMHKIHDDNSEIKIQTTL